MKKEKKIVSEITEYPACRYNDSGQVKVIKSASEEADGWYDSPNPAFRTKGVSAKPVEQKPVPEPEKNQPAPLTKDDIFRMKREDMYALAVSKKLDVAEDIKRPELLKLLLAELEK